MFFSNQNYNPTYRHIQKLIIGGGLKVHIFLIKQESILAFCWCYNKLLQILQLKQYKYMNVWFWR